MRRNIALSLLVCLSACSSMTPEQQAQVRQVLAVACNVDGVVVPVAQPIVATLGPAGATATGVDLLVHPAVVEACKAVSGVPVSVTPVSPPGTISAAEAGKPAN
jgi:ABC-type Fe3+-hydroxamate transport system substrate-binding protein